MEKAPEVCILCGETRRDILIRKEGWTVLKCTGCGLGLLDPRPDRNELNALYRSDYFSSHYDKGLDVGSPEMKRRISQEDHRISFFRGVKRQGRILDIGCGMGYFLHAARAFGYEVEGMDVSGDSASYVQETLKIPVTTGSIEEVTFQPESLVLSTILCEIIFCQFFQRWQILRHFANGL